MSHRGSRAAGPRKSRSGAYRSDKEPYNSDRLQRGAKSGARSKKISRRLVRVRADQERIGETRSNITTIGGEEGRNSARDRKRTSRRLARVRADQEHIGATRSNITAIGGQRGAKSSARSKRISRRLVRVRADQEHIGATRSNITAIEDKEGRHDDMSTRSKRISRRLVRVRPDQGNIGATKCHLAEQTNYLQTSNLQPSQPRLVTTTRACYQTMARRRNFKQFI